MLDLQVRFGTAADALGLDELSMAVHGPLDLTALRQRRAWLYEQNPYAKVRPELVLGLIEDRLVAQTGGLAVPLLLDGVPAAAAWGADTLVHPAWRRRGIAGRMIADWSEQCRHELCLGFGPAAGNRSVLRRLGYEILGQVAGYYVPDSDWSATAPEAVQVRALATDDPRLPLLWQRVQSSYRALTTRAPGFLAWRFAASPAPQYCMFGALRDDELCGYCVLRVSPRLGGTTLLVDWLAHPEDSETLDALLCHARAFGRAQQATGVFTYASHARLSERLLRCGFRSPPGWSDDVLARTAGPRALSLPELAQWHLTLADADKDRPP